jgi:hypothetical protein
MYAKTIDLLSLSAKQGVVMHHAATGCTQLGLPSTRLPKSNSSILSIRDF